MLRKSGAVVELQHAHLARWRGRDAELAEDALVEVLLDHLHLAVPGREDVDRAGVLELLGDLRVVADLACDLDVDERAGHSRYASTFWLIFSFTRSGISLISS